MALAKSYSEKRPTRVLRLTPRQAEVTEKILGYATLIAIALILVLPLYWMLSTALKDEMQTFAIPPTWAPNPIQWQNFAQVFQEVPFGRFIINTFILVGLNIVGELFA